MSRKASNSRKPSFHAELHHCQSHFQSPEKNILRKNYIKFSHAWPMNLRDSKNDIKTHMLFGQTENYFQSRLSKNENEQSLKKFSMKIFKDWSVKASKKLNVRSDVYFND